MEKNKAERYQNIDELLSDLKTIKVVLETGSQSYRDISTGLTGSWLKFSSKKYGFIAAAVIALFILFAPSIRNPIIELFSDKATSIEKHLVVLPLVDLGEKNNNRALCDGMMETITSKLTQLESLKGSLRVVPAGEVRLQKISTPSQAGKSFGATLAISGSLQRVGDQVRMILNLVNTKTNRQLNSIIIDNNLDNVLAFQDSTVIKLAEMLEIHLLPEENQLLAEGGTTTPGAFEFYLKGQGYLHHYRKTGHVDTAIALFQKALEKDWKYALAYVGLGRSFWRKFLLLKEPEWLQNAIEYCQKAVDLNDNIAATYIALGAVYKESGRYQEALNEFAKALKIDPVNSEAYRGSGIRTSGP